MFDRSSAHEIHFPAIESHRGGVSPPADVPALGCLARRHGARCGMSGVVLNLLPCAQTKEVFYGVHGIDGNAQIHPFASVEMIGQACEDASDCGGFQGNVCVVPVHGDRKVCGAVALDNAQCPAGTNLAPLASGDTIAKFACLP